MSKIPIRTLSDIKNSKLKAVCEELEAEGYAITQRKKVETVDAKTGKTVTTWTVKAKLNSPPARPNRVLVD